MNDSSNDDNDDDHHDARLIREAEELFAIEKLLQAAARLHQVKNPTRWLQDHHRWMMKWAAIIEEGMQDLLLPPDSTTTTTTTATDQCWKKQTESHGDTGHRDFTVYYQVNEHHQLTCRIDAIIESSLLVPIISVFNESDLYDTWMPSYQNPIKLGVTSSVKLKEMGRGNQIIKVQAHMGWPFAPREVTQHAVAVDAIDEHGAVAIQVMSETHEDDPESIPPPTPGVVPVDLSCSMLIRGCPEDHPLLQKSKQQLNHPQGEPLIFISLKSFVDAHVSGIPISVINFISRTVFSRLWMALLSVAEGVREGKRPLHQEKIAANRELYDWVEKRIEILMEKVQTTAQAMNDEGVSL